MAGFTVDLEGLAELEEALAELPKATGKNVLKRALIHAGTPIAETASLAARKLTGMLQRSYGVSDKLSRRQRSLYSRESTVEVFAGPGALVQAITEEFGTSHSAAHPTMRPAFDAHKREALASVGKELGEEIEKARARIARKAERLAAQMKR
jgi:HK97 gp10 family phage protein